MTWINKNIFPALVIDAIISLFGFFTDFQGLKAKVLGIEIGSKLQFNYIKNTLEEMKADIKDIKQADLILLSSEPFPFSKTHVKALEKATQKQVLLVDGAYFSWYGSRLQNAFRYFKTLH